MPALIISNTSTPATQLNLEVTHLASSSSRPRGYKRRPVDESLRELTYGIWGGSLLRSPQYETRYEIELSLYLSTVELRLLTSLVEQQRGTAQPLLLYDTVEPLVGNTTTSTRSPLVNPPVPPPSGFMWPVWSMWAEEFDYEWFHRELWTCELTLKEYSLWQPL